MIYRNVSVEPAYVVLSTKATESYKLAKELEGSIILFVFISTKVHIVKITLKSVEPFRFRPPKISRPKKMETMTVTPGFHKMKRLIQSKMLN